MKYAPTTDIVRDSSTMSPAPQALALLPFALPRIMAAAMMAITSIMAPTILHAEEPPPPLSVAKILTEKSADLRGAKSLEERVIGTMKALMENRDPGKIYINIPEVVITAVVPDPAAQTELARTFEQAGWQSVDSAKDADLIIRGEAFAEAAIRRGNLWFTRARLEIQVHDKENNIILTDRVVCGNVDLAQAVGAKGALQKAGLLTAEPVLKAWIEKSKQPEGR